jgi:phasin family protein
MTKSAKTTQTFPAFNGSEALSSEAVRENMNRFMSLAGDMSDLSREGFSAAAESARVSTEGAQAFNARAASYFQDAMSTGMEASKSVAGAKSIQEAVELQTKFAKSAFDTYMKEMSAMAGLMATTMREASEPLNTHAGKFVEKFQTVK